MRTKLVIYCLVLTILTDVLKNRTINCYLFLCHNLVFKRLILLLLSYNAKIHTFSQIKKYLIDVFPELVCPNPNRTIVIKNNYLIKKNLYSLKRSTFKKEKNQKKKIKIINKFFTYIILISISTLNTNIFIILSFQEKVYIFKKYFLDNLKNNS